MILRSSAFVLFGLAAGVIASAAALYAWSGPLAAPPTCAAGNPGCDAPLNIGTAAQVKNGAISVNALAVYGNVLISGSTNYLNFGTTAGLLGYGLRGNAGVVEVKNSDGTWSSLFGPNGGSRLPTSITVTICDDPNAGTMRYNTSAAAVEFCDGSAWRSLGQGDSSNSRLISTNADNVNLFILAGSPAIAGDYTITINSGVTIGSSSSGSAALVSGTWPAGSNVTLVNNGNIYGKEGAGGTGDENAGNAGGAGGPAISLSYPLTIDNTNGKIFGGGGGGGAGGGGPKYSSGCPIQCQYGTYTGGSGGKGQGAGNPSAASSGTAGSGIAAGGNGGAFGAAGSKGANSPATSGGSGGAAGRAIQRNGHTITWLGGNDSTHVKGAVQ